MLAVAAMMASSSWPWRRCAKVREEQLVLRVRRRALAKVEVVGRLDEASAAAPASGHRDEEMGRRYGFIQLDDRKHLRALRDVDRGRQARHKWDLEAAHRWVFKLVAGDVMDHLVLLRWVDARCPRQVWVLPFGGRI